MPLARILTLRPEDATFLREELEQIGFEVEIANPRQQHSSVADLEIEFAICDQQQVLARAAAIATQLQAEIVVFPGAIPPTPKAVQQPAEVAAAVPESAEVQPIENRAPTPQHDADLIPASQGFESQPEAEPLLTKFGEGLRKSGKQAASILGVAGDKLRGGWQRSKPVLASGLAKLKDRASSTGNALATRTREFQERRRLRAAQQRATRQEQRAEAMQQAATLEQERQKQSEQVLAARQQEIQQMRVEREKRLPEMEPVRTESNEQIAALERARLAAEAQHQQFQREQAEPARPTPAKAPRPSQLRGVFTGAAAAAILFIAGMLLANFHGSSPLPGLNGSSVQQELPFGAATVHGTPGVTVGGAKTPKVIRPSNPVPPQAAPAQPKPRPSKTSAPSTKQKSQWHRFRRSNRNGADDAVADDVVVRHYVQPQKAVARNTQQQAGLKRYSDQ